MTAAAEKFADKPILVTEMNMGQYVDEIERIIKRDDLHTLFKANGRPISPAEIMNKIYSAVHDYVFLPRQSNTGKGWAKHRVHNKDNGGVKCYAN
jgi:pyruvate/2-oxoacid:ferredoxin oxidoreductase alpha subunit